MPDLVPQPMLERAARRFAALADPTRLRLLNTLLASDEHTVGDLAIRLRTSQANVSKHLKFLHDEGILGRRQQGTAAYYFVADPTIKRLCSIVCDRIGAQARTEARALAP